MRTLLRYNPYYKRYDTYEAEDLYSDIRIKVLKRDDNKCIKCGENTKRLHVHHIDGNGQHYDYSKMNNNMNNLMTLCGRCHVKIHHD